MITKAKLKLLKAKTRIHELEEILCPCNTHDYKQNSYKHIYGYPTQCDVSTEHTYICQRCKKMHKEIIL